MSLSPLSNSGGIPARAVLAVDIGGTHTKIAVVRMDGGIECSDSIRTDLASGPESYLERVFETAGSLISNGHPVGGVGLSVAGFVNPERTEITYNPNLHGLVGYPLRNAFAGRMRLPVTLDVDSNAACLAEYRYGAGRGAKRLLCLVIGTGFGGAMMIDGALLRTAAQAIGDPGHVIVAPGGPHCSCGGRGCAEAMVSAPAIEALAATGRPFAGVIQAANGGDLPSRQAFHQAGHWLGIAMATLAAVFLPDRILVAGGVAEAGDLLLAPADFSFRSCAGEILKHGVSISKASLGWRAPLVGAVCPFLAPVAMGAD